MAGRVAVAVRRNLFPVAILHSDGDYAEVVPQLVRLAEADDIIGAGESILIKPNLHMEQHWTSGGTVNPGLVGALIEWAKERGAGRIMVADGPYMGHSRPERVFTETGMAELVEAQGAEWAAMPRGAYRSFDNASEHLPPRLEISELVFEFDRLINVAVMKTHLDCQVTLGMKNLKGCISNANKGAFHYEVPDINRAIVALNRLMTPDLTIVDGTLGMEGIGPATGTVANFGHIFAGRHTPSVDVIAASAMGFEVDEVPVLKFAREQGMVNPDDIRVVGEQLERIRRRFERPHEAMLRELPGLRLCAEAACSSCKLNVIRALRDNVGAGVGLPARCIVMGKTACEDGEAIFLGECARERAAGRPHLAGCPPRVERVREFLAQFAAEG